MQWQNLYNKEITSVDKLVRPTLQHRLVTARFLSCGVWDFGVMASRAMFWVLSALTLCSKFVGGTALEARLGWDGLEFLSTTAESTPGFDPQATAHTNIMADQLPAFDESLIEWETLTSKNGKSFRVGREKTDFVKGDAIKNAAGKLKSFRILYVDWRVGGMWQQTSADIASQTGITSVKLWDLGSTGFFRYNFQFYNTENYDYFFYDESGDSYRVNTFRKGKHYFDYNSERPTIKKVFGS